MSEELISRSVNLDAVEFEGGDGRTLHARLFTWDSASQIDGPGPSFLETWERGVFSQSIKRAQSTKRGWPLMYNHQLQALPIGMVPMVHERDDGPWMTAKISRTSLGDDVIELIKDGVLPGVSVNGRNIRSARDGHGNIRRMEVALREVSVTPFPALVGADAMVLRSEVTQSHMPNTNTLTIITTQQEPPARKKLSDYLAALEPPPAIDEVLERASASPSDAQRKKWADNGEALPDGSWPIPNGDYLRRAIQAFGRQAPGDTERVRRWIKRRARELGLENLIPDTW